MARSLSAVSSPLITVLGSSQLITAGWKIAKREAAVRVGPGDGVLWECLQGGEGDDGPAYRCVAVGINHDSADGAGRCGRYLRTRRSNQTAAEPSRSTQQREQHAVDSAWPH